MGQKTKTEEEINTEHIINNLTMLRNEAMSKQVRDVLTTALERILDIDSDINTKNMRELNM